jgi:hypothetical protein
MNIQQALEQQVNLLKTLFNFTGQVAIAPGLVMVKCPTDQAYLIRRGFRKAKNSQTGTMTEVKGTNTVVFVWIDDAVILTRKQIREIALAA